VEALAEDIAGVYPKRPEAYQTLTSMDKSQAISCVGSLGLEIERKGLNHSALVT